MPHSDHYSLKTAHKAKISNKKEALELLNEVTSHGPGDDIYIAAT